MKKRLIGVFLIIIILEVLVFNFDWIGSNLKGYNDNKYIEISEFDKVNYEYVDGKYITKSDPQLIRNDINLYADKISINIDNPANFPFIAVYYTTDDSEFTDNTVKFITEVKQGLNELEIKSDVKNIRVDLGDDSGKYVNNFYIIINRSSFMFNVTRVIVMALIYVIGSILFRIQRSSIELN